MTVDGEMAEIDTINIEDLKVIVRSILVARALEGATIQEIKYDYLQYTGESFPRMENITEFLLSIPQIACYIDSNGTRIFRMQYSEKSDHILEMVKNQKAPKRNTIQNRGNYRDGYAREPFRYNYGLASSRENICFFEDNYRYLKKHSTLCSSSKGTSPSTQPSSPCGKGSQELLYYENDFNAHFYDHQLIGDDFFLSMAKMELKCRFLPGHRILQSGLCISGQTIADATRRVLSVPNLSRKVIVNLGSVDILHGRDLIEIQHDFLVLIKTLEARGVTPVVTTLAPLANYGHRTGTKHILQCFNEFIMSRGWKVIDLWSCMVNKNGHILFECYQEGARYVTGSNQPHVFWNKLGRQRILKEIKKRVMLF